MQNQYALFNPIFSFVRTTAEADELLMHIDSLLTDLYRVQKEPFEKIAYAKLDPGIARAIHEVFLKLHFSWSNAEEVKTFFTHLSSAIKSSDIITINLAKTPSDEMLTGLTTWTRSNISPTMLLEINIDHNLLGGAVVVYKGSYLDLSLRKGLDDYFKKNGKQILENLG